MKIPDQIQESEAVALLAKIGGDQELAHRQAEDILLAVLRSNGLGVVATAFEEAKERVGFWYA